MIGIRGENVKQVRSATRTQIHFEEVQDKGSPTQTLVITGKVLDAYRAHVMMMKRYHDCEEEQRRAAEAAAEPDVSDLKKQVEELQRMLEATQAKGSSKGSGKSKGKGKSKSKGKGKA